MTTIIPERLAQLDSITLDYGAHPSFDSRHCAMEVVAWLAGEEHSDAPKCVSPALREFVVNLNDHWDYDTRQKLIPYLPRIVGTSSYGSEDDRSFLLIDWMTRTYAPTWLDFAGLSEQAEMLRNLRVRLAASADFASTVGLLRRVSNTLDFSLIGAPEVYEGIDMVVELVGSISGGTPAQCAVSSPHYDVVSNYAYDIAFVAMTIAAQKTVPSFGPDYDEDKLYCTVKQTALRKLIPTAVALQDSALDLLDRMIDLQKVGE